MNLPVVFSVADAPLRWEYASTLLPGVLLGATLTWHAVVGRSRRFLLAVALVIALPSALIAWAFLDYARLERSFLRGALAAGRARAVFGRVADLREQAVGFDHVEGWSVGGVAFAYRAEEITHAFHTPAPRGGPVHVGLPARVEWVRVGERRRIARLALGGAAAASWPAPRAVRAIRWAWGLALLLLGLLEYRRRRRRPGYRAFADADFLESLVSGRRADGGWRDYLGVNNALVVAVRRGRLIVRPVFPFDLLGLGAALDFDLDVPLRAVTEIEETKRAWHTGLRLRIDDAGRSRRVELFPARREALRAALAPK